VGRSAFPGRCEQKVAKGSEESAKKGAKPKLSAAEKACDEALKELAAAKRAARSSQAKATKAAKAALKKGKGGAKRSVRPSNDNVEAAAKGGRPSARDLGMGTVAPKMKKTGTASTEVSDFATAPLASSVALMAVAAGKAAAEEEVMEPSGSRRGDACGANGEWTGQQVPPLSHRLPSVCPDRLRTPLAGLNADGWRLAVGVGAQQGVGLPRSSAAQLLVGSREASARSYPLLLTLSPTSAIVTAFFKWLFATMLRRILRIAVSLFGWLCPYY
jgi:hypothetical protein